MTSIKHCEYSERLLKRGPDTRFANALVQRVPLSPVDSGFDCDAGFDSGRLSLCECMTPKVRYLDGVVWVLLRMGLNPCRLHVVLLS